MTVLPMFLICLVVCPAFTSFNKGITVLLQVARGTSPSKSTQIYYIPKALLVRYRDGLEDIHQIAMPRASTRIQYIHRTVTQHLVRCVWLDTVTVFKRHKYSHLPLLPLLATAVYVMLLALANQAWPSLTSSFGQAVVCCWKNGGLR